MRADNWTHGGHEDFEMPWNNLEWTMADARWLANALSWILAGWVFFATIVIIRAHFRANRLKKEFIQVKIELRKGEKNGRIRR